MTPASVQATLFVLADTLMIPHPVAVLAFVLVCVWVLYKWGAPILLICALVYFLIGRWSDASIALVFALFLVFVRSGVQFLDRLTTSRPRDRPA